MKLSKVLKTSAIIAGASYLSYKAIANKAFDIIFNKSSNIEFVFDNFDEFQENIKEIKKKAYEWLETIDNEDVYINSFDGLNLHGKLLICNDTKNYIILVHGWHGDSDSMLLNAKHFIEKGFNCLVIDQRASGLSQGKYFTFGFKESLDLIQWSQYLINRINNISITYYGISLGASTCLMTNRYKLPNNVKCIIEDCGFSSLEYALSSFLKNKFNISYSKPILKILNKTMIDNIDISLEDLNPGECIKNCRIPLLIIHGNNDEIVPFDCSKIIYNNCSSTKKYWETKNRKHAESSLEKNYYNNIIKFINENID